MSGVYLDRVCRECDERFYFNVPNDVCPACERKRYDLGTYEVYECNHEMKDIHWGYSHITAQCLKCGKVSQRGWT